MSWKKPARARRSDRSSASLAATRPGSTLEAENLNGLLLLLLFRQALALSNVRRALARKCGVLKSPFGVRLILRLGEQNQRTPQRCRVSTHARGTRDLSTLHRPNNRPTRRGSRVGRATLSLERRVWPIGTLDSALRSHFVTSTNALDPLWKPPRDACSTMSQKSNGLATVSLGDSKRETRPRLEFRKFFLLSVVETGVMELFRVLATKSDICWKRPSILESRSQTRRKSKRGEVDRSSRRSQRRAQAAGARAQRRHALAHASASRTPAHEKYCLDSWAFFVSWRKSGDSLSSEPSVLQQSRTPCVVPRSMRVCVNKPCETRVASRSRALDRDPTPFHSVSDHSVFETKEVIRRRYDTDFVRVKMLTFALDRLIPGSFLKLAYLGRIGMSLYLRYVSRNNLDVKAYRFPTHKERVSCGSSSSRYDTYARASRDSSTTHTLTPQIGIRNSCQQFHTKPPIVTFRTYTGDTTEIPTLIIAQNPVSRTYPRKRLSLSLSLSRRDL